MTEQEKRRFFRIHFKRQVQLDFSTKIYSDCKVKDISLGGMFVLGGFQQKVNDQCYVFLAQTSKTAHLKFEILAKVIRQDDQGIALEFISMSYESMMLLELILLYEPREDSSDTEPELPADLPFTIVEEEPSPPEE